MPLQYWGVNGFFRIVRGVNAQQIEAGDCWYADPTWEVEKQVADGVLVGSMWGLKPKDDVKPKDGVEMTQVEQAGRAKGLQVKGMDSKNAKTGRKAIVA